MLRASLPERQFGHVAPDWRFIAQRFPWWGGWCSSPLKILEGFCCGIHSNRIHVLRNDFICFIAEGLFCLYNGHKTDMELYFSVGAKFNGSDWPWQIVFGENICL